MMVPAPVCFACDSKRRTAAGSAAAAALAGYVDPFVIIARRLHGGMQSLVKSWQMPMRRLVPRNARNAIIGGWREPRR